MLLPNPEIESVQPDLAAKLKSESYFVDIPVFEIREERVESQVAAALAGRKPKNGKVGVAVEVMMPMLKTAKPNAPGPLCALETLIRVKENPPLNLGSHGTGKTAEAVGVTILQTLHGFSTPGICGTFYPSQNESMVPNRDFPPMVAYDIKLESIFPLTPLDRMAAPVIDCPVSTVSIIHPDPAAVIYYTTDGSFPGPGATAPQAYSTPFVATPGTIIRAAAYKPGYTGSDVSMSIIT